MMVDGIEKYFGKTIANKSITVVYMVKRWHFGRDPICNSIYHLMVSIYNGFMNMNNQIQNQNRSKEKLCLI